MANTQPADAPAFVPPPRCGRCGYATRGLPTTTCPECGFDLTRTPYLRWADRDWLRMIVIGTTMIRVGAVGVLVMIFGWTAISSVITAAGLVLALPSKTLWFGAKMVFLAIAAVGVWLMAAPDPTLGDETDDGARRRVLLRVGVLMAIGCAGVRMMFGSTMHPFVSTAMSCAALIVTMRVVQGLGDVVRELVGRSESAAPDAAKDAGRGGRWAYWVIGVFVVFGALASRRGSRAAAQVIDIGVIGVGVIAAAFALLSLVKSSRAIRDELAKAPPETV